MPNTCMNHKSWYTEEDWPCPTFLLFLHAIITSYQTDYFFPHLEVEYHRPTYYSKFKMIKVFIIIRHPKAMTLLQKQISSNQDTYLFEIGIL